ncbi:MAG: BON domain-containing protein [Ktedonobacterales bacterium]
MHYTRLELQFRPRGLRRGALVEGLVSGVVLGATIHASALQVTDTLVTARQARRRHELVAHVLGTAKTELPHDYVTLGAQTPVLLGTWVAGRLAAVWCDRHSGIATHLLVRPSRGVLRVVPVGLIERIESRGIHLKLSRADFAQLPIYRTDTAISADIALAFETALPDPRARRDVKLRVEDGHVTLAGAVETPEELERARSAAGTVMGVRGLTLDLVVQEALADRVAEAMARATARPELAPARVRIFAEHGIVFLEGTVPTPAAREALEQAALAVPGVRVVVNNLLAAGEPPSHASETGPLTRNR